jgi:hypothetical protein
MGGFRRVTAPNVPEAPLAVAMPVRPAGPHGDAGGRERSGTTLIAGDLQRAFLSASEAAEKARAGAESQRLAERERLVKEAESAQARTRRLQRRSYAVLALILGVILAGFRQVYGFGRV